MNIKEYLDILKDLWTPTNASKIRIAISNALEMMGNNLKENIDRQDNVENQFQDVLDETTGKDVINGPEIIAARNGEANLKARLDKENQEVTTQLAQTETVTKGVKAVSGSPITKSSKVKALVPLDGDLKNYAGSSAFDSGDVTENVPVKLLAPMNGDVHNVKNMVAPTSNASPVVYNGTKFGQGARFDGTQALTYLLEPSNQLRSGGISFHFKPLKNLQKGDNIEYNFMHLYNGDSRVMQVKLNYLTADNIFGVHVYMVNGSNTFVAAIPNVDFNNGQEYSLSLAWDWDGKSQHVNFTLYLNGVFYRTLTFNPNCLPPGLTRVIVGNAPAFNRPAQSIMHNVFLTTDVLNSENIRQLHNAPIDVSAAYFADVYNGIKKGKFYKGRTIEGNKRLTVPIARASGNILEGSASLKIKPLRDFTSGVNTKRRLFSIVSDVLGDVVTVDLNYINSENVNGLNVVMKKGETNSISNSPNLSFLQDKSYSVGIEWKLDLDTDEGYLATYLNGKIVRVRSLNNALIPNNIYQMRIGNSDDLSQPIDSVIESIYYADEAIGTYGHMRLHDEPLDLRAVSDGSAYQHVETEAIGYSGEKHSHIVLNEIEGRLFGVQDIRFGVMKVSDDEGKTWQDYYNFGGAFNLSNPRIDFIEKFNGYEFVGIRDANGNISQLVRSNNSGGYESILSFTSGRYMVNDWNWTSYQNTFVVTEYGQNPSVPSKAYRSTDNGDTWQAIYTAPVGTNHIHSAKFDPYTGWLYLAYGDNITELLRSKDRGETWETLDSDLSNKVISMAFKRDAVYMASDYYGGTSLLRVWDKANEKMFRLSPQVKTHNVHTYAVHFDEVGYLWWYAFADGGTTMTDRHSSFYVSADGGVTEVRLEDLGREIISYPYRFIETKNFMWFGNYKMTKPIVR